jgi:hypothetical protein
MSPRFNAAISSSVRPNSANEKGVMAGSSGAAGGVLCAVSVDGVWISLSPSAAISSSESPRSASEKGVISGSSSAVFAGVTGEVCSEVEGLLS